MGHTSGIGDPTHSKRVSTLFMLGANFFYIYNVWYMYFK